MVQPLLPIRHPEQDFFICDFGDVIPKSDIASMEHPLFTLSTKPDRHIRHYEHNGNSVTIAPGFYGLATIHDKDVLIFVISQLMKGVNQSMDEAKAQGAKDYIAPSKTVRFKARDLLVTTNRQTGGEAYKRLEQAFKRLQSTQITTNIKTGGQTITDIFSLIDNAHIVRKTADGRMMDVEITLSEWLYNAVLSCEVLSINRDYFRLRKPIERRLYEVARKHCGYKGQWTIGAEKLLKKVGSSGSLKKFRETLRHIMKNDHLPDYAISIDKENISFHYKGKVAIVYDENRPHLKPDTIEKARRILGRSFDVYAVESDWLQWWEQSGKTELRSPDGAFINFCKTRIER